MPKFVYRFAEGNKDQKDLLGGKGANLAEMQNLGLPVPPGFTITTDACRAYLKEGIVPEEVAVQSTKSDVSWATPVIRCWYPCDPGRSSRCLA